jgi:hypothetical protein
MEELLSGLIPGLGEDVRSQILDRAQGVPLYAVETVRMLLDRGLLVREGSVYRPTGPIEALEVPADIDRVVLDLLASPNVCSKRWVWEQYDQLVGSGAYGERAPRAGPELRRESATAE